MPRLRRRKIVWRHLQCLSVHRLRQAGQTLDPQTIARANPVDSDTHPSSGRNGSSDQPSMPAGVKSQAKPASETGGIAR
jgi:hypothetical protein